MPANGYVDSNRSYTVDALAKRLGVSRRALLLKRAKGLRMTQIGEAWVVAGADFNSFLSLGAAGGVSKDVPRHDLQSADVALPERLGAGFNL